ncbi:hypothetical protein [Paenibacillus alkalitolerans]|uniref:hypothetical protein n=1 Tax=Paenibacillus alkalitolerans TaxID=2799335 RepID=UPI0018F358D9|nr:hypothetical protein [Paenibacillus alkalitolerans]
MYASIRHYRMAAGSIDDLMHRVDTEFADRLQEKLGLLCYQAIDTGNGTIMTIALFECEEQCRQAEAAAEGVRDSLSEFRVECTDIFTGEVMVSRATEHLLKPIHH